MKTIGIIWVREQGVELPPWIFYQIESIILFSLLKIHTQLKFYIFYLCNLFKTNVNFTITYNDCCNE